MFCQNPSSTRKQACSRNNKGPECVRTPEPKHFPVEAEKANPSEKFCFLCLGEKMPGVHQRADLFPGSCGFLGYFSTLLPVGCLGSVCTLYECTTPWSKKGSDLNPETKACMHRLLSKAELSCFNDSVIHVAAQLSKS